jgi:hypothetical protein
VGEKQMEGKINYGRLLIQSILDSLPTRFPRQPSNLLRGEQEPRYVATRINGITIIAEVADRAS